MIRADENMPEMTADEAAAMEREFNDYCEWYEARGGVGDDDGSTTVQMPSTCDCVEDEDGD